MAGMICTVIWAILRLLQFMIFPLVMLLVCVVARQRTIIYVPTPPGASRSPDGNPYIYRSPDAWDLPYEDVTITTEDGTRISGWFVYRKPASIRPGAIPYTFLYFHGNGGNIGYRLENVHDMWERLCANILIIDYRGYGDSDDGGGPCQSGFLMDAIAAYRWLVEYAGEPSEAKLTADRILLFGQSVGGAVACCLVEQLLRDQMNGSYSLPLPAGIVLENTFTSLQEIACSVFSYLKPVSFLLKSPILFDEWKTAESIEFIA